MIAEVFTRFKSALSTSTFGSSHSTECECEVILLRSSLLNCSGSVRFHRVWTAKFKSSNKFSFGPGSGLWLGRSRTFTLMSLNHFCEAFAVCFSLSCRKINHLWSRSCPSGFLCVLLRSFYPLQASQGLLWRSVPTARCCRRHASQRGWCVWCLPNKASGLMAKKLHFDLTRLKNRLPVDLGVSPMPLCRL